ncbi:alcohol dehydrogenase catalytic domain-containing protein [Pseudonocardia kongjuensis]|uniref:alcohol dehydrogenase catalytic domain-containing protein n=1 Tax=Pseudonocardia kongjuensis TaxID=102227 RepID=UPI0031D82773
MPAPDPPPGTVEVDVAWCGICASDVHEFRDGPHVIPRPDRPHPLTGEHLPVTLGHEISGHVSRVGQAVSTVEVGVPVAVNPLLSCGRCNQCLRGLHHLCRSSAVLGLSGRGGGLAERVVVPASLVYGLPDSVTLEQGALAEPLSVAWHAARLAGAPNLTTALVVGVGPVGLALVLVLRALGVPHVLVAARRTGRRTELAEAFGAEAIVGVDDPTPARSTRALTSGEGVDAAFDAAGTDEAVNIAIGAVRRRGTVVNVALRNGHAGVDLNRVLGHEITIRGSTGYLNDHPEVLRHLAAGAFTGVERLVTGRIDLDHAVPDGFEPLLHRKNDHVKILVAPTSSRR